MVVQWRWWWRSSSNSTGCAVDVEFNFSCGFLACLDRHRVVLNSLVDGRPRRRIFNINGVSSVIDYWVNFRKTMSYACDAGSKTIRIENGAARAREQRVRSGALMHASRLLVWIMASITLSQPNCLRRNGTSSDLVVDQKCGSCTQTCSSWRKQEVASTR